MNEEVSDIFGDGFDSDEEDSSDDKMDMMMDLSSQECRQQLLSRRPKSCGVMAFHSGTEEALFLFVLRNAIRGDAESVLKAIDVFCYSRHWMMHCGDQKIQHLERAVSLGIEGKDRHSVDCNNNLRNIPQQSDDLKNIPQDSSDLICLEIGSYCGYSAIKIASLFNQNRKDFLYCVGEYCDLFCTCSTYYFFTSS